MKTRTLRNIEVSEVGMGCMAFSHGYGQIPSESYSIEAIQNAYRHGCTFFDTAEVYSPNLSGVGHNEKIVGKALKDVRNEVVIATKLFLRVEAFESVYKTIRKHKEDTEYEQSMDDNRRRPGTWQSVYGRSGKKRR